MNPEAAEPSVQQTCPQKPTTAHLLSLPNELLVPILIDLSVDDLQALVQFSRLHPLLLDEYYIRKQMITGYLTALNQEFTKCCPEYILIQDYHQKTYTYIQPRNFLVRQACTLFYWGRKRKYDLDLKKLELLMELLASSSEKRG